MTTRFTINATFTEPNGEESDLGTYDVDPDSFGDDGPGSLLTKINENLADYHLNIALDSATFARRQIVRPTIADGEFTAGRSPFVDMINSALEHERDYPPVNLSLDFDDGRAGCPPPEWAMRAYGLDGEEECPAVLKVEIETFFEQPCWELEYWVADGSMNELVLRSIWDTWDLAADLDDIVGLCNAIVELKSTKTGELVQFHDPEAHPDPAPPGEQRWVASWQSAVDDGHGNPVDACDLMIVATPAKESE